MGNKEKSMKSKKNIDISVMFPVYNEEKNISPFLKRLIPVMNKLKKKYEVIFIYDPSSDNTYKNILKFIKNNKKISLIGMSRRWGQNACLMAGLENSNGKTCVTIDVDLQDPPELIAKMYNEYTRGYEVILMQRKSRKGETFIRMLITRIGYWLINKLSDVEIKPNVGDFRLLSRKFINKLIDLKESHGFFRGLIPYLGFPQKILTYDRDPRNTGVTKYNPYYASIKHGIDGIVAFSIKPLTLMISFGSIIVVLSFLVGLAYLISGLVYGNEMSYGMMPILLMTIFFGGIQILCFGLLGQYIGRIYEEVRDRPRYIIKERIN